MIASGVCGNPEVVEHEVNGLLVDPNDHVELRDALQRLLDDPELGRTFVARSLERRLQFTREGTFGEVELALRKAAGLEPR